MKITNLSPQSCENSSDITETPLRGELTDVEEATAREKPTDSGKSSGSCEGEGGQSCASIVEDGHIEDSHVGFMRLAIEQARMAYADNEVPIGAIVVCGGQVVALAHNEREGACDPTAHAEVLALRRAGETLKRWNLYDCDLYVTIEPCAMCSGAIINSRIRTVYFGATDPRFGCGGSLMNLITDPRFNHRAEVVSGICESEARELMQSFFRERRFK